MPIPIVDLFAGPGGLGEGFSSCLDSRGKRRYEIALSIEKDEVAHRTLQLRAFFRQFDKADVPDLYYRYIRGETSKQALFAKYKDAAKRAALEAWHAELGNPEYPNSLVDETITNALAGNKNHWVLIGGPPCQAYSLVGRARIIGEKGRARYEADHRHFLYREYLRIIAAHGPAVFVMENVKGLLSASVNNAGIFGKIVEDLQAPSAAVYGIHSTKKSNLHYNLFPIIGTQVSLLGKYEPEDFIVRCEEQGLPQTRHRVIIVGVRSDIAGTLQGIELTGRASLEQAIDDLPAVRSGLSKESDSHKHWLNAVCAIKSTKWWNRPNETRDIRDRVEESLKRIDSDLTRGAEFIKHKTTVPKFRADWYVDKRIQGICNHSTRGHIREDLHRYLYASAFAEVRGRSPKLQDFPSELLPNHQNVEEALKSGKFNDRFRVQLSTRPATTITSHISKDGHYFIHYRPDQCRSLTVREAARVQTFPDNYFFEGARTDQYRQVGNAVPPLLAREIAAAVAKLIG